MHLTLHLTNNCNLTCNYCYAGKGEDNMSPETAEKAIKICAGEKDNCGIVFFGGEPLLCKDTIFRTIELCKKKYPNRFHFKITTNGLLLERDDILRAAEKHLHIALSHDGIKEAHDRFRVDSSGTGTYEKLLPKLEMLLEILPYSPIMMTVNPETVDCFADSVIWLQSKGVRYLIASLNFAGTWTDATLKKLKRQYKQLAEWHFDNYRNERKIYFSPFDKRIASHIFCDRPVSCQLGIRQISIGPDGTFYPCVQFVGHKKYSIGSVHEGVNTEKVHSLYELNEKEKPSCTGCALERRCHNKCGCLNFQLTGRIDTIPPILCEHERMILPIVDKLAEKLFSMHSPMFIQRHYNSTYPVISFLEDLIQ